MKTIALVVPYFGKLPYNFQLWLEGCRYNRLVDWLLFTNDSSKFDYPNNVKVTNCTFAQMKKRIQEIYDFPIVLDHPYKLCDYRVAYGEIFSNELKDYDYWGYCDVDLLFGNIREFITDSVLEKYEKIGFQGHLTIYLNTKEVSKKYRVNIPGIVTYKEIFTNSKSFYFDEDVVDKRYEAMNITVYKEVHFAHLRKYSKDFHLAFLQDEYKNNIFTWEKGCLKRYYLKQNEVKYDEMLYIHFFCRKMNINIGDYKNIEKLLIYPNTIIDFNDKIDISLINKMAHSSAFVFYLKYLLRNIKKMSLKKILFFVRNTFLEMRRYKN